MAIRRDALDDLFSRYIRLKADNHCEYCGEFRKIFELECSHFHSRRKWITRLDEENCVALCATCHRFLGEHPNIHSDFFRKRLGSERFEQLNIRAQQVKKRLKWEYEELKAKYREKIKYLEKGE